MLIKALWSRDFNAVDAVIFECLPAEACTHTSKHTTKPEDDSKKQINSHLRHLWDMYKDKKKRQLYTIWVETRAESFL